MEVNIHCIGKVKWDELDTLINEYKKRIKWQVTIKEFVCKKALQVQQLCKAESELLLKSCDNTGFKIALDPKGDQLTNEQLGKLFEKIQKEGNHKIYFLIGGPYGHASELLEKSNKVLSLSKLTFSHQLVRLILMEQLYRSFSIITTGHPYHK